MDTKPISIARLKYAAGVALVPVGLIAAILGFLGLIFGCSMTTLNALGLGSAWVPFVFLFWLAFWIFVFVFIGVLADLDSPVVEE